MANNLWSVDLHAHTTYSDGSQSPEELVRLAKANGVRVLAVTDHDHTGGIDEALAAGAHAGLEIIPGIELSVSYAEFEDIHLLAYYFAWHAPELLARLEAFRVARETRAERILERINAKLSAEGRQPIAYADVKAHVKGAFGRPHIATQLVQRGYAPDMNAAFRDYLIPCNVPKYYMPAAEALTLIRQARGLSSVAHPKFITPERARLRQVLAELSALGLDGIEAYHSDHHTDERLYCLQLANQLGLTVTGGSDYHGFKPHGTYHDGGSKLGSLQLPYGMAVRLRRVYLARYPLALLLLHWPGVAATALRRTLHIQYQLRSVEIVQGPSPIPEAVNLWPTAQSIVLSLPRAKGELIGAIVVAGEELGVRMVAVPWETAGHEPRSGLYETGGVTAERFQRTPVERLAHELIHEAILAQLR
jgi:predicted metal-dependent phosphoesterase TrpH